MYMRIASITFF